MGRIPLHRPSPAMVVSLIALVVAMSGTGYAAINLEANSVGAKELKKKAVTGPKIRNNAVTAAKVKDDSLTGNDVLESSLSIASAANADKLDNVDSSGFVKDGASAGGDLAGSYPNPSIAANAVNAGKVANGTLTSGDVGLASGTVTLDFPSIAAQSCDYILHDPGVGDISNDPIVVSAAQPLSSNLFVTGWHSNLANFIRVKVCNVSGAAIDPPSTEFYYIVFNNS